MERLTFNIELRRMNALSRILMLVARLGGVVRSVHAESHMMGLSVDAPIESAHRFGPQLRRVIDVLEVTEAPDGVRPVASQAEPPVASQAEWPATGKSKPGEAK
jgi:hypothetical protein